MARQFLLFIPRDTVRVKIVYKKSSDGGLTWSERIPVPESWKTSKEVPTIYRVVDKDNKKRLIVFSGLYPARMAVSEDEGNSWSELSKIGDWGGIVVMASFGSSLKQGKVIIWPCSMMICDILLLMARTNMMRIKKLMIRDFSHFIKHFI